MALVRVTVGVLWLSNTGWKTPPDFAALRAFTGKAVEYPVFPPFSWLVEEVVLPNFLPFAWGVLLIEAAIGALLVVGLATRATAVASVGMAIPITLSVALAPNEWQWAYYLMIACSVTLLATAAGRTWGLDGVLRPVAATMSGRTGRVLRWFT